MRTLTESWNETDDAQMQADMREFQRLADLRNDKKLREHMHSGFEHPLNQAITTKRRHHHGVHQVMIGSALGEHEATTHNVMQDPDDHRDHEVALREYLERHSGRVHMDDHHANVAYDPHHNPHEKPDHLVENPTEEPLHHLAVAK